MNIPALIRNTDTVLDQATRINWVAVNFWNQITAGFVDSGGKHREVAISIPGLLKARRHRKAAARALQRLHAHVMA